MTNKNYSAINPTKSSPTQLTIATNPAPSSPSPLKPSASASASSSPSSSSSPKSSSIKKKNPKHEDHHHPATTYHPQDDFPPPGSTTPDHSPHQPLPIHLAAQRGDLESVTHLLDSNLANPTDTDHELITPLHWSAINGHLLVSSLLISRGAIVDAFGGQLMATPLMWAARNGRVYIVHLLLKHGADPNLIDSQAFNSLHLATHSSSALTLSYLLSCAYDRLSSLDSTDREGHTSLHWACYQGDSLSVELLLSHRASVSVTDNNGMTPLHWAVVKGNANCIRQIVQAGADVLARTIDGKTPQDMAIELKSTFAWNRGLAEAGLNSNGTRRTLPLGDGIAMKSVMFGLTIICLGLGFQTFNSLPYYTSIFLIFAQAYGTHHIITNTILDAKTRSGGRPSDLITQSPYFSTIIVASFFWVGYTWITHVLPQTRDHSSLNLFFILSSLICVYNFVRSITLDPGFVPLPRNQFDRKTIIEGLVEASKFDGMNFCINCESRKPLRSKHCRICKRCIGKFDHHCPWIWNCVGVGNHRQFLVFVGNLILGISLFDILTYIYFKSAPDPRTNQNGSELPASCSISIALCKLAAYDSFTLSVAIWATLQLIWTMMLMISQLWLISRQMTTFELSNVNRFGYMGGRAGTSMASQSSHTHHHHPSAQSSLQSHHHHHRKPKSFMFCLKVLGLDRFLDGTQLIKKSKQAINPFNKGIRNNCLDFWSAGNQLGINYLELFEVPEGGFHVKSSKIISSTIKIHKSNNGSNGYEDGHHSENNLDSSYRLTNHHHHGYERLPVDMV